MTADEWRAAARELRAHALRLDEIADEVERGEPLPVESCSKLEPHRAHNHSPVSSKHCPGVAPAGDPRPH